MRLVTLTSLVVACVMGVTSPICTAIAQPRSARSTPAATPVNPESDAGHRPGHPNAVHVAGIVLAAVGGAAMLAGVVLFVNAALAEHPFLSGGIGGGGSAGRPALEWWIGGGVTAGLGFGALAAGLVLLNSTPTLDGGEPARYSFGVAPFEGGMAVSFAGVF
jgi:hypothetical protein